MTDTRIERDPLGEKAVPASALYGIQTLRAAENFPISGLRPLPAFVDAVVWGRQAENCSTYLKKGRPVFVEGRLRIREYEARDGGGKRRATEIVANRVQFLGGRPDGAPGRSEEAPAADAGGPSHGEDRAGDAAEEPMPSFDEEG